MKHTLTENEQTLIQGGCIDPDPLGGFLSGGTVYDPTYGNPWPPSLFDFDKIIIIH